MTVSTDSNNYSSASQYPSAYGKRRETSEIEYELLNQQCKQKSLSACGKLAAIQLEREGNNIEEMAKRVSELEGHCAKNDGNACLSIGSAYIYGVFVNQDYAHGFELLSKACELGEGFGCWTLGMLYRDGVGIQQSYPTALGFFEHGCQQNDGESCNDLGILYFNGEGVRQDKRRSMELFNKGCDLNSGNSCINLADELIKNDGNKKTKAKELYGKACDIGEQVGCEKYKYLNN